MTTIYKNQKRISYIIYIIALLMWGAVIHHIFFEAEPVEINEAAAVHKEAKRVRNDTASSVFPLIHSFANGEISKEEFLELGLDKESKFQEYTVKSASLYKEVGRLKEKHKTFGFSSYNIFSFQLSARIVLFLCILLLFLSVFIKNKSRELTRAFKFAIINFLTSFAFFTVWVFYKKNDLELWVYYTFIFLIAVLSGLAIYYSISWAFNALELKRIKDQKYIDDTDYALNKTIQTVELLKQKILLNKAKL